MGGLAAALRAVAACLSKVEEALRRELWERRGDRVCELYGFLWHFVT